ncbi:unnamed protein product [Caenorhabditis sp. 36 PRJEB53466]|nr:unnamed protein product [Caenorhabditis sp. 36 PRJEB53466]
MVFLKSGPENKDSTQTAELIKNNNNQELRLEPTDTGLLSDVSRDLLSEGYDTTGPMPEIVCTSARERFDDEIIRTSLQFCPWYHGMMFSNVTKSILKWDNSYLVRRAIIKQTNKMLCLSLKVDEKLFHYQLICDGEGWTCPKLYEKFPQMESKKYAHLIQLLDAWSLITNHIVPVPRSKIVLYHESINLIHKLGSGAFGEVFKASFLPKDATEVVEVAVKRTLGEAKREHIQEMCHEARVMGILNHLNVVALYGIASLQLPMMLVMELVTGGDLKKYLQTTANIPNKQIFSFALDIARGMSHLAKQKVIHRDLAARNCLITPTLLCKISDFGLSVIGTEMVVKSLKKAPKRWLAPETFNKGIFNEKTDVWSYGVVLTELMTRCAHDPLHPMGLKEAEKWIKDEENPHRIDHGEPRELAMLVDCCCAKLPEKRFTFASVKRRVAQMYERSLSPNAANPLVKMQTARRGKTLEEKRSQGFLNGRKPSKTTLTRKKSKDQKQCTKGIGSFRREKSKGKLPAGMMLNSPNK